MSARLQELQVEVAAARHRLEGWASRLAEVRRSLTTPGAVPVAEAATPLFTALGQGDEGDGHAPRPALEDVELHFEVLDTEDPGREGR